MKKLHISQQGNLVALAPLNLRSSIRLCPSSNIRSCVQSCVRSQAGFSTILALLLTGFLLTLAAGVLFLFLSESRTNQSLFNGIGGYYAADGAAEYALLKIKNHREGFEDTMIMTLTGSSVDVSRFEGDRIALGKGPRAPHVAYQIVAAGKSYSGGIQPGAFEIIPLFVDPGKSIKTQEGGVFLKHPDADEPVQKIEDFQFILQTGEKLVWNVIGNNTSGATFGISGILGTDPLLAGTPFFAEGSIGTDWNGQTPTQGKYRKLESGVLTEGQKSIEEFLAEYEECYLVLYNPASTTGGQVVKYEITAPNNFTLPRTTILASGRMKDSVVNLEMTENKSKLFELLKYSLYVAE